MRHDPALLSFRPLTRDDLPLMHTWLNRPHVARWWGPEGHTLEMVEAEYGKYIDGVEAIHPSVVLYDGVPAGYMQWERLDDFPHYKALLGVTTPGLVNCDVFIGENRPHRPRARSALRRGRGSGSGRPRL